MVASSSVQVKAQFSTSSGSPTWFPGVSNKIFTTDFYSWADIFCFSCGFLRKSLMLKSRKRQRSGVSSCRRITSRLYNISYYSFIQGRRMEALSLLYRKTIFSKSMICKIQRDDNFYDL